MVVECERWFYTWPCNGLVPCHRLVMPDYCNDEYEWRWRWRGHHWDFGKFFVLVFFLWNNAVSIFFFFSLLIQFAPGCPTAITPSTSNYCISAELDNHREYSHQHLFWSHSETHSHPREHLHMTQSSRFILHVSTVCVCVCVCTECVSVDHSSKQNRVGRKKKKAARRVHLCLSNKMGKGFPFGGNTTCAFDPRNTINNCHTQMAFTTVAPDNH